MFKYLAFIVAALTAVPALAGSPLTVESSMLTVKKQAAADGTTRVSLVPAAKVVPGDKVIIRLSYRNTGTTPIGNVVLNNPLPQGIAYRAPSAGSLVPDVSVDGRSFGQLATLRVATPSGGQRAATADDVTHVRWRIADPIPVGARGQVSVEAILK